MRRKPNQARAEQKVRQILEGARLVLIERGLERFTTNHVAQKAGCNIGTVYRYFPDKADIIKELYRDWLAEAMRINLEALKAAERPIDPSTFVAELFKQHLMLHDEDEHRLSAELTRAVNLIGEVNAIDTDYDDTVIEQIALHHHEYCAHRFGADQIAYGFKLAITLLVMISAAKPDQRESFSNQAVNTLQATIRSWYLE